MTIWCVVTVGVDFTVELQRWMRIDNLVPLLLCACIVGTSCAVLSLCMICMKGQKTDMEEEKPVVILVQDSPEPTRTWSSPFAPTPMRRAKARYGGRRRFPSLKVNTLRHDPKEAGHCAYSCVIAAAGKKPTLRLIRDLRQQVAMRLRDMHVQNLHVADMPIRELIRLSEHNLASYVAATAWDMWASQYEIMIACEIMKVGAYIRVGEQKLCVRQDDQKVRWCIRYKNKHYTLHRINVKGSRASKEAPVMRGGMMNNQRTELENFDLPYVLDVNPLPTVADQERRVVLIEGPQRDSLLSAQLQLEGHPSMLSISEAISRVTGVATYRLAFYCPDDAFRANPIPMWVVPPPHMMVKILPQEATLPEMDPHNVEVEFNVRHTGATF